MQIHNPYDGVGSIKPLRSNFHTHTTRSDGARPQQVVIDDYAQRGYDCLMLSDHDVYTSEEELAALDSRGMLLIPGNEVSRNGPHMLHIGPGGFIEPDPMRQQVISDIRSRGGIAVVNHPNWNYDHCSLAKMQEWLGYTHMEIYNGTVSRLNGCAYATNKWDMLLADGRRVWGMANDDSHLPVDDVALGWNMVYAKERTPEAVYEALEAGRYYASTGVVIRSIEVDGSTIRLKTENAQRINAIHQMGRQFAKAEGSEIEVTINERCEYVRFECWGPGESFAWTQPIFIKHNKAVEERTAADYINDWQLSQFNEGMTLAQAPLVNPEANPADWTAMSTMEKIPGFASARQRINGRQGVIYLSTTIPAAEARAARLHLGYDGPVRVWLNDQVIFDGPGDNPATPDKTVLNANLKQGDNRLTIALDSNKGNAWGIFARID